MPPVSIRRLLLAAVLCFALLGGTGAAYGAVNQGAAAPTPSPTTTAEKQRFAKTRFVANAGLAAGATYEWIYKPFKDGKFKKGADGRRWTLIKAGLAGVFTYNRLKAALHNAQGDPTLSRAVAPLEKGINSLKDLPNQLRSGDNAGNAASHFNNVINDVKDAGKSAGVDVQNKIPSTSQLTGGG